MQDFVNKNSIVRDIWGNSDTILLVFAGASAEFALNKAVDWLYFTGKLPNDPMGRLFSTVNYAREIVFSDYNQALNSIDKITSIHNAVEKSRGQVIPAWAYKDVLYMLIDYSVKSFEILERPLNLNEKQEVLDVFRIVGERMGLKELPVSYNEFETIRKEHLKNNLFYGEHTKDLYKQYKKHLGIFRYTLLIETQIMLLPKIARAHLNLRNFWLLQPLVAIYKIFKGIKFDWIIKEILLPPEYKTDIKNLNISK